MSKTSFKLIVAILLLIAGLTTHANSQANRARPVSTGPCPDDKVYTGKYRNIVFGFSIVIPAGLKGYWNSAVCSPDGKYDCVCMGDHGRIIPLADDVTIEAFVGYQMESEWSVIDHENGEISSLKKEKNLEQLKVVSSRWVHLDRLNARRFVAKFVKEKKRVTVDQIVALHKGIEYQLILRTSPDRYKKDKIQFDKVIASWK